MNNTVKYYSTTKDKYDSLDDYDSNSLYFVPGRIYKGDVPLNVCVQYCDMLPDVLKPETIYVTKDKRQVYCDINSTAYVLSPQYTNTLNMQEQSNLLQVPTSSAVTDAIKNNRVEFSIDNNSICYKYGQDTEYTSLIDVASLKQNILDELNMGNSVPSSLTVFKLKTTYFVGDIYSDNDLSVFVQYTNGRTVQTSEYTLSVDTVDTSKTGTTEVVVTYVDNTTDVPITLMKSVNIVVKYPEVVSITGHKLRTKYNVDDVLNLDDISVIAYYDNGDVKELTEYTTNIADINMGIEGTKALVITCHKDNGTDVTYTIMLYVTQSVIYSMTTETQLLATNSDYIDTGIKLLDENKDWTVFLKFKGSELNEAKPNTYSVLHCMEECDPYPGVCLQIWQTGYGLNVYSKSKGYSMSYNDAKIHYFALVKSNNTFYSYMDSTLNKFDISDISYGIDKTLLIGAYHNVHGTTGRYWNGTVYECKIFNRALDMTEVEAFISSSPSTVSDI